MTDDDECGAVGGMKIGEGNQSIRRKPAPMSLRSTQILHFLTWYRTRAEAAGNPRLTASAMACPLDVPYCSKLSSPSQHFLLSALSVAM
jgi:hypothetical protein